MDTTTKLLLALLRSVLTDSPFTLDAPPSTETLSELYDLAKRHELAPLAAEGLMRAGLLPKGEIGVKFRRQRMAAIFSDETKNLAAAELSAVLSHAGLDHILLKGYVLRNYYPAGWMRTRCDIDALVRAEQLDAACSALQAAGYRQGSKSEHDVRFTTPNGVPLELHFVLVPDDGRIKLDQLNRVWENVTPTPEGSCRYEMNDPMFYCYHVAHIAKHLRRSGCGLRPFIDLWLLDHRPDVDLDARRRFLETNGLLTFSGAASALAESWLSDTPLENETYRQLERFVLSSNAYGALMQVVVNQKHGPIVSLFYSVFPPYRTMVLQYPALEKHPWMYPLYFFVRWFRLIFCDRVLIRKLAFWRKRSRIYKQEQPQAQKMMKELGLL